MTPEDYKILKEKAELWDSLSPTLRTQFAAKFPYSETLQNTSNASSHVGLLEEEEYEWVSIGEERIKLIIPPQIKEESKEICGMCFVDMNEKCFKCGGKPFGHFELCQKCLDFNHSGNGNF